MNGTEVRASLYRVNGLRETFLYAINAPRTGENAMTDETNNPPNPAVTLLPCPFCGGEANAYEGRYTSSVKCDNGHAIHEYKPTLAEAIAAWNTRQSIPAAGVGEGVREALEPFAREADAQERVTTFSSGESVILRTKITIGQLRRARIAFAALSTPDALLLGGDAMRGEGKAAHASTRGGDNARS